MFFIGKNFILHGQENTGTIYQVNNGQMIFHGNFLQAQVFFACNRKPCAGFYCLIIGNYHTLPSANITNPAYGTTAGQPPCSSYISKPAKAPISIKGVCLINQISYAFPCSKFIFFFLLCNGFFASAQFYFFKMLVACG